MQKIQWSGIQTQATRAVKANLFILSVLQGLGGVVMG